MSVSPSLPHPPPSALIAIAEAAGTRILAIREAAQLGTRAKTDGSPVTLADHAAQDIILKGLHTLTPDIPVISEEKINICETPRPTTFWLVDPIDATKDFIAGGSVFTINIGLVIDGIPRVGLIYAPARDDLFYSDPHTHFRLKEGTQTPLQPPIVLVRDPPFGLITNRSENKRLPLAIWESQTIIFPPQHVSGAYKFGLLAATEDLDFYPRTIGSSEWDTAAGDAILRNLGGGIFTLDGKPLTYGKKDFLNPSFLACKRENPELFLPYLK